MTAKKTTTTKKAPAQQNPFEILTAPTRADEIEWRIAGVNGNKSLTSVVPYINNRAVMNRFDEAFTPVGWRNTVERLDAHSAYTTEEWINRVKTPVNVKKHAYVATIWVKSEWEWIGKTDGADETDIESTKGGISDAHKRAAVLWGVGRDLYNYPKVFLKGEHKFIPDETKVRLEGLTNSVLEGKDLPKVIRL